MSRTTTVVDLQSIEAWVFAKTLGVRFTEVTMLQASG
jgi:hypothetical protein